MITWTEIPCTDLSRVQTFYSTVFGWTTNPSPHEEVAIFSKGLTNGSFVKLAPEAFLSPAIKLDNSELVSVSYVKFPTFADQWALILG
jgi:hypothetical protein